jgi:hypothetical protein
MENTTQQPGTAGSDSTTVSGQSIGTESAAPAANQSATASASVGDRVTVDGLVYEITGTDTATVVKEAWVHKNITIPNRISVAEQKYRVTKIAAKAFWKCTSLQSVSIGKNVDAIGKQAFAYCMHLKRLTIKTSGLKKKNIGRHAFSGIGTQVVVKVPGKKRAAYKRLLQARGLSRKAQIK